MIKGIYPYYKETYVGERDCFPDLKMTPSAMLILVQEVSGGHLASLGYDYERLLEEGIVFMLSSSATKILRTPICGEKIIAATCPAKSVGAHMMRETVLLSESEEVLAVIEASWVMLDTHTGRILRPSALKVKLPLLEKYEPFKEVWNMRFSEEGEFKEERQVKLSDLDRNRHMNNTVYAKVITDLFPEEILEGNIEEISIKYKKQAKLGDTLSLYTRREGDTYYINAKANNDLYFQGSIALSKNKS